MALLEEAPAMWCPCLAVHLGLGSLPPVCPPCVLKEALCCCPCLLSSPVQPFLVCWCSDQSAINHQTNVRARTRRCVPRTRPAGSQPRLFMLWGWAFCGPDGGSYRQIGSDSLGVTSGALPQKPGIANGLSFGVGKKLLQAPGLGESGVSPRP